MKLLVGSLVMAISAGIMQAQSPSASNPPGPLKHGPMDYYQHHCARCHGLDGGAYDDNFTKDKPLSELRDVILRMAAGQGGAPLTDPAEIDAQVSYHYSIDTKAPFLVWTGADGQKLSGEITPDAKLTATISGAPAEVNVKGRQWTLELPTNAKPRDVKLTVKLKETVGTLDLGHDSFIRLPVAHPN